MSKLADLIRRATRTEPAPIGFAPVSRQLPPTMVLVAFVGERWAKGAADAVAAGADAVLLTGRPSEKELAEAVSAADGRPCGLIASEASGEQASRLREAGLDFVVLEPQTPASALLDEKLGFVLHLRDELTDTQLRVLDALSLDALYLGQETGRLTISRQTELQRIGGLARKALLLAVQPDAGQDDLRCLREAGVALVGVDTKERAAGDAITRLRGVIDGLPRRRKPRGEERPSVSLPGTAAPHEHEEEEEEE